MAKFALLLNHRADRYRDLAPEDYLEIIKDYVAWVEEKAEQGIYAGGHKLDTSVGKLMRRAGNGVEVHDVPSTEVAEVLGGLMIIEAADLDGAAEIARDHPHFRHNSELLVWPIDEQTE